VSHLFRKNARELHGFLEVGKDFSSWIKIQIERARLVENRDFVTLTQKGERKEGVRGASIDINCNEGNLLRKRQSRR